MPPQQPAPVNPWETAAAQLKAEQAATTPTPAAAPAAKQRTPQESAPWVTVEERSGSAFARRLGRGTLWALVVLLVLVGTKSLLLPKKTAAPAAAPNTGQGTPAYPTAEAQVTASRFVRAYLSWDEKDPAARAAQLAAVLPEGADTSAGWSGKGRQEVLAVEPGSVTPTTQQQARVRVDVLIRPAADTLAPAQGGQPAPSASPTASPSGPAAPSAYWIGMDVPVVQAAGRVIVSGQPGIVGVPAKGPRPPELKGPETDSGFSQHTSDTVSRFFKAYAAGGDTESVTAPGTSLPPLPAGITLTGVTSWTADKGSGSDRSGTARVSWQIGGAQLEQTYRIRLTRVASADAERWQVAGVTGGTA
uniref:SLV.18 n=1 Tax=Streptomyces lavendulae TaxID=1914 RepID=Q6RGQ2_STRLA|nr:SLV.18 [Streptomyces lavendulae]